MGAIIDTFRSLYTITIKFETNADNYQEFITLAKEFVSTEAKKHPGFVSANYHVSEDFKFVMNYAQWKTKENFTSFLDLTKDNPIKKKMMEYNPSFETWKVVHTS